MTRTGPDLEALAKEQVARRGRGVWCNHRLHHDKNEHYWFTVTTPGTADRLFGTNPDPATVPTSPTVRALHALEG